MITTSVCRATMSLSAHTDVATRPCDLALMCFSMLPPNTPSADSEGSSVSFPMTSLPPQQLTPLPGTTSPEGSIRKRVVRACEVCRRKKVKCNGQKPCSQCIAFAEECNYVDVRDRSAYSRRYVESLEARMAELERQVAILIERGPCDSSCHARRITDSHRRASDPGTTTTFSSQRQVQGQLGSTCSDTLLGQERVQALFDLESSIDLVPLSAASLIEEANAALGIQDSYMFSFSNSSQNLQAQISSPETVQCPPHIKHESDMLPVSPQLPSKDTFWALLNSYSQRTFHFFSVCPPQVAQSIWTKVTSPRPQTVTHSASELALLFAIMACGAHAVAGSSILQATNTGHHTTSATHTKHFLKNEFEKHAGMWTQMMGEAAQLDYAERLRQSRANSLLSFCAAGRGDLRSATDHIEKAKVLLEPAVGQSFVHNMDHSRLVMSIGMLDHIIRSALGRLPSKQQSGCNRQPNVRASWHDSNTLCLLSALQNLSELCSESGSVGRTLDVLLSVKSDAACIQQLRTRARDQDRVLLDWYNTLPVGFRSSPTTATDPSSTITACITSVILQFERLRLQLALQHLNRRTGRGNGTGHAERLDLDRCLNVARGVIRTFPAIQKYLVPSPWLTLYAKSVGMSAAFFALTAATKHHGEAPDLVAEIETALVALEQLEQVMQGITCTRLKLTCLVSAIKARSQDPSTLMDQSIAEGFGNHHREEGGARGVGRIHKKLRSATMPQNSPMPVVSPISRPETAPPLPREHPLEPHPSLSLTAMQLGPQPVGASLQWSAQPNPETASSTVSWNHLYPAPIAEPSGATQLAQAHQPGAIISSQSHALSLDLNQQELAGLLQDFILPDQHVRRQGE